MRNYRIFLFPFTVFLFVFACLSIVQLKVENPLLLAERFVKHGGWFEIFVISLYGGFLAFKMSDVQSSAKWRVISWTVFSIVFFSQLLLGIIFSDKFLMTGNLHVPVPVMIISGPIYRGQLSVMTGLFLSTVILTGPAWCSHLCYFGGIDAWFSRSVSSSGKLKNKMKIKYSLLFLVICATLLLRWFKIDHVISTLLGIVFGLAGIIIIVFLSRKKGKMIHCTLYCPVGTIVNYLRFINPFEIYIDTNCTFCSDCTSVCKYDALTIKDLTNKKPGITCTLCGDCLSACQINSLKYKLFRFNPDVSRKIYLFLSISIHAIFLALARI